MYVDATYAADPLGTAVTWTDGSTHFVGYDAFGTVQAGVTAVASGGTVDIAAGTYTEQVTITQSLTLDGAGAAVTTIQAPANFLASSDEITIASGASVAMSGFTVAGRRLARGTGIADDGGTLTATDIEVFGFYYRRCGPGQRRPPRSRTARSPSNARRHRGGLQLRATPAR